MSKEITKELITKYSETSDLSQVYHLRLFDEKITKIKNLELVPQLRVLNLVHNYITEIEGLGKCPELKEINLSHNRITGVSSFAFEGNKFLMNLNLSYNQIEVFTTSANLQKLQILNLENNKLTSVEFLNNLKELRILNLSHNKIKKVDNISYLTKLEELYLKGNEISSISEKSFSNNPNLYTIDISHNQLKSMSFIQNIPNLLVFKASHNQLQKVDIKQKMLFLETLDVSNNLITTLSDLPKVMPNLVNLNFASNENLMSLDLKILEDLEELREINFKDNFFVTVGIEEELHKKYPYLEVINEIQFQRPGFKELCEIEEMKKNGETAGSESEWTDISSQTSEEVDLEGLKKNVFLRAAEAKRYDGVLDNEEEFKKFMDNYQMEMHKLRCKHLAITKGNTFLTEAQAQEKRDSPQPTNTESNPESTNDTTRTQSEKAINSTEEFKDEKLMMTSDSFSLRSKGTPSKNLLIRTMKNTPSSNSRSTTSFEPRGQRTSLGFHRQNSRGHERRTTEESEAALAKNKENFNKTKKEENEKYKNLNIKELLKSKNRSKLTDAIKMSKTIEDPNKK